jgi:2-oxoglutarate dehydrogenase E2 component (dihydrolipoamide succinyltransferase)
MPNQPTNDAMPIELKIPSIGESITEVQISEWLKSEGDVVKKDEVVAVIDSEKSTFELSAPEAGRLKILHQGGDTVKVGEVVAQIEPGGAGEKTAPSREPSPTAGKKPTQAAPDDKGDDDKNKNEEQSQGPAGMKSKPSAGNKQAASSAPETKIADAADKRKDEEQGLTEKNAPTSEKKADEPTGAPAKDEPTTPTSPAPETEPEEDAPAPTPARATKPKSSARQGEKIVPMTMLRRTVSRRLVEAKQQMAMLTTFNEADMSAVQTLRAEHQAAFEKNHQTKLGFMSFFVKAVVDALKQFPQLHAEIRGNDVVYHGSFDIGVAIASERGLVVPVLRDVERMSFAEVEKAIGEFSKRAKEGKLSPAELEGGTFTITNGGVFGSLLSTPIINPPQSGILGMHAITERPVAVKGEVVIRPMMYLALTYDHRIVDGREAVLFLRRIKEVIENPARLLIGI